MSTIRVIKNMSPEAMEGRLILAKELFLDSAHAVSFKDFEDYNYFNTRSALLAQLLMNSENEAAIDVFLELLRSNGEKP